MTDVMRSRDIRSAPPYDGDLVDRLVIETVARPGDALVVVAGEIDLETAPVFARALVDATGSNAVVVDMSGVEFMDSTGLRALLETRRAVRGRIVITQASRPVARLLEITGLSASFGVPTEAA